MKKLRRKNGFTLMEIVAVVGVIAILCGIGIPAIVHSQKSLNTQQEVNYAKSIYLAAQDNLSTMKINGSIKKLKDAGFASVYDENGTLKEEVKSFLTDEYAALITDLETNDTKHEYYYIKTSDTMKFLSVVPKTAVDSSIFDGNHDVTIIFNIKTGDVLFVSYGKDGKYSGKVVNSQDKIREDAVEIDPPTVKISNGTECRAVIKIPTPARFRSSAADISGFLNALRFEFTVSDKDDNSRYFKYTVDAKDGWRETDLPAFGEKAAAPGLLLKDGASNCYAEWTLDSLIEGGSFAELNGQASNRSEELIPIGHDVEVAVKFSFNDPDYETELQDASATGNPLFDKIVIEDNKAVIAVKNGRNLQNLNNIDPSYAETLLAKEKISINLTGDINWSQVVSDNEKKLDKTGIAVEDPEMQRMFKPLLGEKLFKNGSKAVFNGNGKQISNLFIVNIEGEEDQNEESPENNDNNIGLFKDLYIDVKDITFTDPIVAGYDNVGVLAGRAIGATVKNVRVLLREGNTRIENMLIKSRNPVFGTTYFGNYGRSVDNAIYASVGLLIGEADDCTVSGSTVSVEEEAVAIPSSDNYGLLIGYAKNSTVSDCTVKGTIIGNDDTDENKTGGNANIIGGIIGKMEGGELKTGSDSGIDVTADVDFNGIVSCYFGGAVGAVYGGEVNGIRCEGDIQIATADELGKYDALPSEYGAYASPGLTGYAGKFVGYIDSGTFSNDTADYTASSSISGSTNYADMQFVGAVKCTNKALSETLYISNIDNRSTDKFDALLSDERTSTYKATDFADMIFTPIKNRDYYTYNGITLSNCKYKDKNQSVKSQTIVKDESMAFYEKSESENTCREMNEGGQLTDNSEFFVIGPLTKDKNGKEHRYMLTVEKKVVKKDEINTRYKKGEFFRNAYNGYQYDTWGTADIHLWDSEEEMENNFLDCYYSESDNKEYQPNYKYETYYDWGVEKKIDEEWCRDRDNKIQNTRSDIYKFCFKTIDIIDIIGSSDNVSLTPEQYNSLSKYAWVWKKDGDYCHMYSKSYGENYQIYIDAYDVHNGDMTAPIMCPQTSYGRKMQQNLMYDEATDMIYRPQYTAGESYAAINVTGQNPTLSSRATLSGLSSTCSTTVFSVSDEKTMTSFNSSDQDIYIITSK